MPERALPGPIIVRDAFFVELNKIGVDDETKWHTEPKTKALHDGRAVLQMLEVAKPALFLRTGEKSVQDWTNDVHKDTVELIVYCVSEDPRDPEHALWLLMADVERAFRESYSLSPALDSGYMTHTASTPHMEEVAGKGGLGFGIVRGHAYYQTSDTDT